LPTDSVSLDGSASNDPDGTISKWLWQKISGPTSSTIVSPAAAKTVVRNLVFGFYEFELTVTDNGGLSTRDTVRVNVDSLVAIDSSNRPIANAGVDQILILPTNSTVLDGSLSTPGAYLENYLWTKISGPSSFNLATPNAAITGLDNLVEGVYQFELKVTYGVLSSKDTVKVTVNIPQPACTDCPIVFVSNRDGNAEIYSCNADGSGIRRLTNDGGTDGQPVWSFDGKRIAFVSSRTGVSEIYIMNADGSNVTQRTFSKSNCNSPTWSPDGTMIAFSMEGYDGDSIWLVGTTNGAPTLLLGKEGTEKQPVWSPDGTTIAMSCELIGYAYHFNIYTIKPDGTGFTGKPLLTGLIGGYNEFTWPSWSPDGKKLAVTFTSPRSLQSGITNIGVANADGSGLTVVTSSSNLLVGTSWSGDGTRIAYTFVSGSRSDILWVSSDGSSSGTIVTNGWSANWKH
jgi:hypothetical protein